MSDDIRSLLEISEKTNNRTISLTRCLILALLAYFVDGIQYRELKAALRISDGKLISNLNLLRRMQYIGKIETEIDRRKIDVYVLTEKGKQELNKIKEWMKAIQKVAQEGEMICQVT